MNVSFSIWVIMNLRIQKSSFFELRGARSWKIKAPFRGAFGWKEMMGKSPSWTDFPPLQMLICPGVRAVALPSLHHFLWFWTKHTSDFLHWSWESKILYKPTSPFAPLQDFFYFLQNEHQNHGRNITSNHFKEVSHLTPSHYLLQNISP